MTKFYLYYAVGMEPTDDISTEKIIYKTKAARPMATAPRPAMLAGAAAVETWGGAPEAPEAMALVWEAAWEAAEPAAEVMEPAAEVAAEPAEDAAEAAAEAGAETSIPAALQIPRRAGVSSVTWVRSTVRVLNQRWSTYWLRRQRCRRWECSPGETRRAWPVRWCTGT